MATILQAGTAAMGGNFAPDHLQQGFLMGYRGIAQFRQFAQAMKGYGPGMGKAANINTVSDFATVGTSIAETATITAGTSTVGQGTVTPIEWGQAIDHSEFLRLVSQQSPEEICRTVLARDAVKTLENAAEAAFDDFNIRYVGTSATGGEVTTNGTATVTNVSKLNAYHLGYIVDYLKGTLKVPPFDAQGNFVGIVSVKAARNIKSDSTFEVWKQYANAEALLSGEIGRLDGVRMAEATMADGFSNAIGTGSLTGEGYFFGQNSLYEAMLLAPHVRQQSDDYGRINGFAWYAVTGYGVGQNFGLKWCSA